MNIAYIHKDEQVKTIKDVIHLYSKPYVYVIYDRYGNQYTYYKKDFKILGVK